MKESGQKKPPCRRFKEVFSGFFFYRRRAEPPPVRLNDKGDRRDGKRKRQIYRAALRTDPRVPAGWLTRIQAKKAPAGGRRRAVAEKA